MVYGQGFSSADDVVAHELTHGVTQRESDLFSELLAHHVDRVRLLQVRTWAGQHLSAVELGWLA